MYVEKIHSALDELPRKLSWYEASAVAFQHWVQNSYEKLDGSGKRVQNFLNGTWLGHPLHPLLVSVPIGAWTAALLLDGMESSTGRSGYGKAADAAVALGSAAAASAAVAGITDWQHTVGKPRRLGFLHALLNTTSLAFYVLSMLARATRQRELGRSLAFGGYMIVSLGAYIGGDLSYRYKIGVKHGPVEAKPAPFTPVLPEGELAEGAMKCVRVGEERILLARRNGQVFAIAETCSHDGGPLSEGTMNADGSVTCPWHGSRFHLETGYVINGPSAYSQVSYEVRVNNGLIELRHAE